MHVNQDNKKDQKAYKQIGCDGLVKSIIKQFAFTNCKMRVQYTIIITINDNSRLQLLLPCGSGQVQLLIFCSHLTYCIQSEISTHCFCLRGLTFPQRISQSLCSVVFVIHTGIIFSIHFQYLKILSCCSCKIRGQILLSS